MREPNALRETGDSKIKTVSNSEDIILNGPDGSYWEGNPVQAQTAHIPQLPQIDLRSTGLAKWSQYGCAYAMERTDAHTHTRPHPHTLRL